MTKPELRRLAYSEAATVIQHHVEDFSDDDLTEDERDYVCDVIREISLGLQRRAVKRPREK